MKTNTLHLAYIALIVVFAATLLLSFPYSLYIFATIKALIILFIFMHFHKMNRYSHFYLIFGFFLLGILIMGILDDVKFRPKSESKEASSQILAL